VATTVATGPVYVYGFVPTDELPELHEQGIGDGPVGTVERGGITALVSPVEGADIRLRRKDLHAHLRVLETAFQATTILPCPFGTVVESAAELEERVLAGARDGLLAGLDALQGTVQMNVKATYDEEALLREIVAADPDVAALRQRTRAAGDAAYGERLRLGEIVAARIAERAEADGERLLAALAAKAIDVAVDRPGAEGALRASFLVARKSLGQFDQALEALAGSEQPLLRFEAIGPLPPTAFAAAYAGT
jgi:hypothetical protein